MGPSAPLPILVIDDNRDTRDVLQAVLRFRRHATVTADNGLTALDYLRAGNAVSLIVLDLRMPVMDGWTFFRELRADPALADIPVIAFSANVEGDFPGAIATIRKGIVDPDVMLGIIERVVAGTPPAA
ncbi:MAG TPA: response regulator [Candidatus Binatia bacterium]|nr:response regulator [Candidatus Binatia bacterium]